LKKKLKIAIFSGEIPAPTFVERLINGLAATDQCEIYLFGVIKNDQSYPKNVRKFGYRNSRFYKLLWLIKYGLLLFFYKNGEKKKLDLFLKSNYMNSLLFKVKFYPVLWHKPDIFHLQWAKGIKDWVWVKEFNMKLVVSFLGTHINISPITDPSIALMYKKYFPRVDAFHAISQTIASKGERCNAEINNTSVIYSSLDSELFSPRIQSKSNDVFKIISVGRKHWVKGYTYAIDAIKLLKDRGFTFKYTIIGAKDDLELAYQIHDLGLWDEVNLIGARPFYEIQDEISKADLLILPSVEEGIANVVLEAMALRTLVLTTDCGGMSEVVRDGENGFIIPVRQSKLMADRILEISQLSEIEKAKVLDHAFQKVLEQHHQNKTTQNMLNFYKHL